MNINILKMKREAATHPRVAQNRLRPMQNRLRPKHYRPAGCVASERRRQIQIREKIQDRMTKPDYARGPDGHGPNELKAPRAELDTARRGPV